MKLISLSLLMIIVGCTSKQQIKVPEVRNSNNSKGYQLKTTFYVYNQFDSLSVKVFEKDSVHQLFQIENDTFPNNPFENTNYTLILEIGKQEVKIMNRDIMDALDRFENLKVPPDAIRISNDEMAKFRNFDSSSFILNRRLGLLLTHSLFGKIDSVSFIEDDFDDDGMDEICLSVFNLNGNFDFPGFLLFFEKVENQFQLCYKDNISGFHHQTEGPRYLKKLNLFTLISDRWGTCFYMEHSRIFKYFNSQLIFGPLLVLHESSCVNAEPDVNETMFWHSIKSKLSGNIINQLSIETEYNLSGRLAILENGSETLFEKKFKIDYHFNSVSGKFEIIAGGDSTIFNEDNFSEAYNFTKASLEEILHLKEYGTETQKKYLKDFNYFDE